VRCSTDLDEVKVETALDYATGTSDRNGEACDMAGYQGVIVMLKLAAVAGSASTTAKIQCDDNSSFTSALDIEDSKQTIADNDDNQIFLWDVRHVPERYIRVAIDKGRLSHAVAETAVYIKYAPTTGPSPTPSTIEVTVERLTSGSPPARPRSHAGVGGEKRRPLPRQHKGGPAWLSCPTRRSSNCSGTTASS
jgi:hypothetical protein